MKTRLTLVALPAILIMAMSAFAQTGFIKCAGNVGRAGLFVDDQYLGPCARFTVAEKYSVDPGSHEVTIKDPRYEPFTTTVTVEEGKTTTVRFKLQKKQPPQGPFGRIRFGGGRPDSFMSVVHGDISPVYLNGEFWGYIDEFNNPGSGMVLPPGTYELRVDSPIYGQINEKVTVEANRLTVIPLKW